MKLNFSWSSLILYVKFCCILSIILKLDLFLIYYYEIQFTLYNCNYHSKLCFNNSYLVISVMYKYIKFEIIKTRL